MNTVLGIDLGTTYSCVAWNGAGGKPVVLKNAEGELTTPSVVFFESQNSVVVGTPAKESAKLYPDDVVSFVKRHIGRPGAGWDLQGLIRTPEEISSYILRKLVNDAVAVLRSENKLGPQETITDVVITCPAYFGINERESTRRAGEIAGLNVLDIINEPTAAAITYGITDLENESVVLVYDLGGGTFDVTMIDVSPGSIKVVCTGGDHSLGGKMWDDRVIEYLGNEFARQTGRIQDILQDPVTYQELVLSAERAKKMLSAREKAPVAINFKGERASVELTRQQFDALTADLLERTMLLTAEMLEEAAKKGYTVDRIDEVLLVGGSTRMPQVTRRIREQFDAPVKIYDPDEAVAKGAAIYAGRRKYYADLLQKTSARTGRDQREIRRDLREGKTTLQTLAEDLKLDAAEAPENAAVEIVNVTSRSFGTVAFEKPESEGGEEILYHLILKNAELPAAETKRFYTVADGQRSVHIRVLESLSSQRRCAPEEGEEIGVTVLDLPEGLPAGSALDIEFRLGESGLLELSACEATGGGRVEARFETAGAISEKEFQKARSRLSDAVVV